MKDLFIDIETYAEADLAKVGVYRYSQDKSFEILLLSYSVDGGEVKVVDLANGETMPPFILSALSDPSIRIWAFNCQFERICCSRLLYPVGTYLNPNHFYCDMIWSAYLGLPLSLEKVGYVLGLEKKKLDIGKNLISYFCKPCSPTKSNGGRTRNMPSDNPEAWEQFKTYNVRDVETLLEIHHRLEKFPVPDSVWNIYHINEAMQDRGVRIDSDFVNHAVHMDQVTSEQNLERATELTGLDNFCSPQQLKQWLLEQSVLTDGLAKADVKRLLEGASGSVEEALKLRQELSKTSNKKYITMQNSLCPDGKVHGTSVFYGSHTGRFAGRLLQTSNLVANHLKDIAYARDLVMKEDFDAITKEYGSVSNTLSELIRTAIIPSDGHRFLVCDFSQVENRLAAYVIQSKYMLDAYSKGEDLYCAVATKLFGIPVTKTNENKNYRKYGKICCLALNYGGSVGALKAFGASAMGISESEMQTLVNNYRQTNPELTKAWNAIDNAVKLVLRTGKPASALCFKFTYDKGILFAELPSGRKLAYCKPRLGISDFGTQCIQYEGVGLNHKWQIINTRGAVLFENLIQAMGADLLYGALERFHDRGFKVIMTVHDEVVIDVPVGTSSEAEIVSIMTESPSWAPDLILKAECYSCQFYEKE